MSEEQIQQAQEQMEAMQRANPEMFAQLEKMAKNVLGIEDES